MKQEGHYSIATEPVSMELPRARKPALPALEEAVSSAYNEAKEFISSLDQSILRCKKYNEDRSYKKYEAYIRDLERTNRELKGTIALLEQTISPTKQYMMDLLDKVVQMKQEKDALNRRIGELADELRAREAELEQSRLDIQRFQKVIRGKVDKLPLIEENPAHLESTLRNYLREKEKARAKTLLPPSSLEEFIVENRSKLWGWSLAHFLEELEKHVETAEKPRETEDLWRAQFRASKELGRLIGSNKHTRACSTKHSLMSINKTLKKSLVNTSAISEC